VDRAISGGCKLRPNVGKFACLVLTGNTATYVRSAQPGHKAGEDVHGVMCPEHQHGQHLKDHNQNAKLT